MNTQTRKFDWLPDLPDKRDYRYSLSFPLQQETSLPSIVDLRQYCSTIEDQGNIGSCTANALAGNMEFLENKYSMAYKDLSRLFIYYNERRIEGTVRRDSGAFLRDGIKSLVTWGVCSEDKWSYIISLFKRKPAKRCYTDAKSRIISSYYRLDTLVDMKNCLADGFPFVFGFTVYDGFMSQEVANTGIVNMPGDNEKVQGGHAVCAVGYFEKEKRFLVRNSWGEAWGQNGYFTIPFDYLIDRNLSDDFWTIRR